MGDKQDVDLNELLDESDRPHVHDPELGTILFSDDSWHGAADMDVEVLGDDIKVHFDCPGQAGKCPESLRKNTLYVIQHFDVWWNRVAPKVNAFLKSKPVEIPDQFELESLTLCFEDELVSEESQWDLELRIKGLLVIEIEFKGLQPGDVTMD